jgi:hypothetical protein
MAANQAQLVNIATQQESNAQQLYSLTEPGLGTAESFAQSIASGDPTAIMKAIAPTAQAAGSAAAGAKQNIEANAPAGGEKNLALEMTDVNRAAQVSGTASNAALGAPTMLANLAGQGVSEGIQSAGVGVSGASAASQSAGQLGQLQVQGQEINAQEKGSQLGALGSLAGAGAQLGSSAMTSGATSDLATAMMFA